MNLISCLNVMIYIFIFIWVKTVFSEKSYRQTSFVSPILALNQETKLQLKHVFDCQVDSSFNRSLHPNYFQVWDNPTFQRGFEPVSASGVQGLDFRILGQLIDSEGELAFGTSKKVLKARRTILNLARMAAHAYKRLPSSPWKDLEPGWHVNSTFGWKKKSVRGYVFSDKTSSNLVIAFKGTTFSFLPGGGGTTSPSDRASDNLMFSCCCGATNGAWGLVCSCGRENNVCSERCLKASAKANTTYFHGAKLIYDSVLSRYKDANIVLVGHSLGGALASLVGLKTGTPAFSFEAPGDRLYAERLGLGLSGVDRQPHIFHFGHNADPIFMGTCNGKLSLCYIGGYAMDSRCHTATECTFDAVGSLGWSQSILHHRSSQSLRLYQRWADDTIDIEVKCSKTQDCVDCSDWKFIDKAL